MVNCTTIVVIGGTGHFGGRICRRLAGEPNTKLIVTSRSAASAGKLVTELLALNTDQNIQAATLDQFSPTFEHDLKQLDPDIVLHTAGPYQGQDYRVAEACITCGSHYVDLADGRDFVAGFNQLDERAKQANVLLISGASTLPGLSSAVVDSLRGDFGQIRSIEISIAPAHQTPRGASTIAAVLSYCGNPFRVLEGGHWNTHFGWQNLRRQHYPDLGWRLSGVCDVPDLSLLPIYVAGVKTVTFHAALEAWWEQLALWAMGWLTRLRVVRSWQRFVPLLHNISERFIHFGSNTGGMHIRISGLDSTGHLKVCNWYLTAGSNHGPEIPCSPALVLVRKLVRNQMMDRGAVACLGLMTLLDFKEEVKDLDISWQLVG